MWRNFNRMQPCNAYGADLKGENSKSNKQARQSSQGELGHSRLKRLLCRTERKYPFTGAHRQRHNRDGILLLYSSVTARKGIELPVNCSVFTGCYFQEWAEGCSLNSTHLSGAVKLYGLDWPEPPCRLAIVAGIVMLLLFLLFRIRPDPPSLGDSKKYIPIKKLKLPTGEASVAPIARPSTPGSLIDNHSPLEKVAGRNLKTSGKCAKRLVAASDSIASVKVDDDSKKVKATEQAYIECHEPNCGKRYKHVNGLKYHRRTAHPPKTEDGSGKVRTCF